MSISTDSRIVIVGGGAGGLGAAYYLEKQGFRHVTVLERAPKVGGMCHDIEYAGRRFGMGAISVTPDYHCVNELIDTFRLSTMPCPVNLLMDRPSGEPRPLLDLVRGQSKAQLIEAIATYYYELTRVASRLKVPGFRNLDRELAVPFSTWLEAKGLGILEPMFRVPITAFGYGRLEEIPAAYALKYMDYVNFGILIYMCGAELLKVPPHQPRRLTDGLQAMLETVAGTLREVRTSATIARISRDVDPIRVELATGEVLLCDALVLALPLETKNLGSLDLRPEERRLFDKVFHNRYFTVACEAPGLSYNVFFQLLERGAVREPKEGTPILVARWWEDSNLTTFYCVGDATTAAADVERSLKVTADAAGLPLGRIQSTCEWEYFSHVSSADLAAGFYDELEALQGVDRTYYAGKLMNFELVENSLAYSKDLVQRFFAPRAGRS